MNQDLLKQAIKLFDTDEKWNSFLELIYKKDTIKRYLWEIFQSSMNEKFGKHDIVEGWSFWSETPTQYRWYLTEYGKDSCYIILTEGRNLMLWANGNKYNLPIIRNTLNSERFSPLFGFVDRIDQIGNDDQWNIFRESGNLVFGSSYDNNFPNDDRLTWFAANRTTDFVEQIAAKVNRVRKDENMTLLLRELNEIGRK